MVFDHIGFNVSDLPKTKAFLLAALEPLGLAVTQEAPGWALIGRRGEGEFWIGSFGSAPGPVHIAFSAKNREQVRQFHAAALAAGAKDNGAPGIREKYHPNYYGAYVIGPDGHNLEAVCHAPEA
jgi:catechol 2,3-dioxygenase-like lactoylglutathione lyase family enzyme